MKNLRRIELKKDAVDQIEDYVDNAFSSTRLLKAILNKYNMADVWPPDCLVRGHRTDS